MYFPRPMFYILHRPTNQTPSSLFSNHFSIEINYIVDHWFWQTIDRLSFILLLSLSLSLTLSSRGGKIGGASSLLDEGINPATGCRERKNVAASSETGREERRGGEGGRLVEINGDSNRTGFYQRCIYYALVSTSPGRERNRRAIRDVRTWYNRTCYYRPSRGQMAT